MSEGQGIKAKKYGGVGPSELKRLRQLEEENLKLKRLVADLSLDQAMLQDVLPKSSEARSAAPTRRSPSAKPRCQSDAGLYRREASSVILPLRPQAVAENNRLRFKVDALLVALLGLALGDAWRWVARGRAVSRV